jgi:hypothetical protein
MKSIVSHVDRYTGLDIVEPLIRENVRRYGGATTEFRPADLVRDPLPAADMILCRDCLVHLPFRDIRSVIANFKASGSRYLLVTTFSDRDRNFDVPVGDWRPLNLMRPPFDFPPPVELIREDCTEYDGRYADKSLGLWRLADL